MAEDLGIQGFPVLGVGAGDFPSKDSMIGIPKPKPYTLSPNP